MALLETDPIDFLLGADGDIVIDTDMHWSSGLSGVAQAILITLLLFKGEWFLDLDEGTPYFESILGEKFDEASMRKIFETRILKVEGVLAMASLTFGFDGPTRTMSIAGAVRTVFGDTDFALDQAVR